jgi:hypothetical protein
VDKEDTIETVTAKGSAMRRNMHMSASTPRLAEGGKEFPVPHFSDSLTSAPSEHTGSTAGTLFAPATGTVK